MRPDHIGALLLLALGVLTLGTGLHFFFFRPAMLPEDVLFTGVDPSLLKPEMLEWLRIVLRTWGAFIVSFGILMLSGGVYMITSVSAFFRIGMALALLVAFAQFLASNVRLHSDYLLFVGVLSGIAFLAAGCLLLGLRHQDVESSPRGVRDRRPKG